MDEIDELLRIKQEELIQSASVRDPGDDLGKQIADLRDEKESIQNKEAQRKELHHRIDELMAFLDGLPKELTKYDEAYVRTLIEKITVFEDHFIVELKSGFEIEVKA